MVSALEFRREAYGLSTRAFSKILGIANSHYSEFVNGKRLLPLRARCRAAAIGVPMTILLNDHRDGETGALKDCKVIE